MDIQEIIGLSVLTLCAVGVIGIAYMKFRTSEKIYKYLIDEKIKIIDHDKVDITRQKETTS